MNVEILIVTYRKDFPWLEYCLRAIAKYAHGFAGVTVAIPRVDRDLFAPLLMKVPSKKLFITPFLYDEVPCKGVVHHCERICHADQICGEAEYVMHMDADCIMNHPQIPEDYFRDGKPIWVHRPYSSLGPNNGDVWKPIVERNIGRKVEHFFMCRHPTVCPVSFYPQFRAHVASVHKMPFSDYVISQRNEWPAGFAEFTSMGAWAFEDMHDDFHWINCFTEAAPKDLMKQFWSHGGLDQWIGEGWHDAQPTGPNSKKELTPRMQIELWLK